MTSAPNVPASEGESLQISPSVPPLVPSPSNPLPSLSDLINQNRNSFLPGTSPTIRISINIDLVGLFGSEKPAEPNASQAPARRVPANPLRLTGHRTTPGAIAPKEAFTDICGEKKTDGLSVTSELIENIVSFVSNEKCELQLGSEEELNVLKIFVAEASHKKSEAHVLRQIKHMRLENYQQILSSFSSRVNRHRKNENIRTVLTVLHKYVRNEESLLRPSELEPFRKHRYSELRIVEHCAVNPDFYERLVKELQSSEFRKYCQTQLKAQLASYLLLWARYFKRTGKWKARFVAFPLEIESAAKFFSLVFKK